MAGIAEQLRQAVLQAAIQGKLTEQLPEDGDARELLADIQAEKAKLIAEKKIKKEKALTEITNEEFEYELPDNWCWCCLQAILDVRDGTHDSPQYYSEGVPFVTSKNLVNGKIDFSNVKYISEEDAIKFNQRSKVEVNDILMAMIGSIGKPVLVDDDRVFAIKNMALVKHLPVSMPDMRYILILLNIAQTQMNRESSGGVQKFVSLDYIRKYRIPLPPLAEQHRLVARVDELMAKIDELEKVENELNALHKAFPGDMKAALLQAAMQGKLTEQLREDGNVDELLLAIEKERNELIAKKEIKKDDLENLTDIPFDVPESWRWVKLNNIVIKNIKRGKSPTYAPNSHILVFAQKCNTKAGYINMDLALFLDEDKAKKYPNSEYMQDADTVINSTGNGTLGRVGFYRESDNPRHFPVVPDSHVTVVRTSSKLNKKYVMYCLKYFQPYFEKKCTGSTNQTELGVDIVKNLPFPVPPIKEQQRIVEKLDKLLPLCDSLEEKL